MASSRATNGRVNEGSSRNRGALALAVAVLGLTTISAKATDFFDWGAVNTPVNSAYVQTPYLTDSNAAAVNTFLSAQQAAGNTLAVQVRDGTTLSASTINLIFNNASRPVKYIFADFEGGASVAQTQGLVNQIAPTATGSAITNGQSFIGNFGLAPIPSDTTQRAGTTYTSGNGTAPSAAGPNPYTNATDFRTGLVNMSNEALYPGNGSFRNPVTGDSTAPNILSAMFTLPIQRLSTATQNMGSGQIHIPYITRFNNWANPSMANTTYSGPQSNGTQPAFDTNGASINGQAVSGQLLSRNDFQALVLHYKMRGADSYQLLDPGVVGYTVGQMEQDAQDGWNNSLVGAVLAGIKGRVATMPNVVTFNSVKQTIEQAGVVWSAVTNDGASPTDLTPRLAILVSNLSPTAGIVSFNTRINGLQLTGNSPTMAPGSHMILRFTKSGTGWGPAIATPAFDNAALASRDGIGIPEPTSIGLLGLGALGVLGRRRRRA